MSLSTPERQYLARQLLPLLDLTSLGEDDTPVRIQSLCDAALAIDPPPAALCVYPEHVTTVRRAVGARGIAVATVVNFPEGGDDPERIARETRRAIGAGADEVDMVLPWRALAAGQAHVCRAAVAACRQACGPAIALKLILETGQLHDPELIREASRIGLDGGVDFLKTSTGKVPVNATPESVDLMLDAIAAAGGRCGLKVAGGVRTLDDAAAYVRRVEQRMGPEWVQPRHLRFGASALFAELRDALAATP